MRRGIDAWLTSVFCEAEPPQKGACRYYASMHPCIYASPFKEYL